MESVRFFLFFALIGRAFLGIAGISALRAEEHGCLGVHYAELPVQACAASGLSVELERITPISQSSQFVTSVAVLSVCTPPLGVCSSGARAGLACFDHNGCQGRTAPQAWCDRECAVTRFEPLELLQIRVLRTHPGRQPVWFEAQCRGVDSNRDGVFPATSGAVAQASLVQCPNLGVEPGDCLEVGIEVATPNDLPPAGSCIELSVSGDSMRLCAVPVCGEWGSWTLCPEIGAAPSCVVTNTESLYLPDVPEF